MCKVQEFMLMEELGSLWAVKIEGHVQDIYTVQKFKSGIGIYTHSKKSVVYLSN